MSLKIISSNLYSFFTLSKYFISIFLNYLLIFTFPKSIIYIINFQFFKLAIIFFECKSMCSNQLSSKYFNACCTSSLYTTQLRNAPNSF
ncbi:MAG: hypothetical protein Q8S84_04325 [bacterium]|nr:hypothetical protein [bacterium]